MTANDIKSYISYLNKLLDQYNNTFNRSIGKNLLLLIILLWLKKLRQILKLLILKLMIVRVTKYKSILRKCYIENWSSEVVIIDPVFCFKN